MADRARRFRGRSSRWRKGIEAVRDRNETLAYTAQDTRSPYTIESQIEMQAMAVHRMADQGGWKRRAAQVYVWLSIAGPLVAMAILAIWLELGSKW